MKKYDIKPRPDSKPILYAFSDTRWPGALRIGQTNNTIEQRMDQHYPTKLPSKPYKVEVVKPRYKNDKSVFTDGQFMKYLQNSCNVQKCLEASDDNKIDKKHCWFKLNKEDFESYYNTFTRDLEPCKDRDYGFSLREEQEEAVNMTFKYFNENKADKSQLRFLWNAKMRFGKTFATYKLAEKMKWQKIIVLTWQPYVIDAWKDDLERHIDFKDWNFYHKDNIPKDKKNLKTPYVLFGSFQDYTMCDKKTKSIKSRNKWVSQSDWDCVILDEYHYGAWRDKSQRFVSKVEEDIPDEIVNMSEDDSFLDKFPIKAPHCLCLSGTPFRAIATGEFLENQIFNWTYQDEQRKKAEWKGKETNPYTELPTVKLLSYQIPNSVKNLAMNTNFNEFDLNKFFKANKKGKKAEFEDKDSVQKWLDFIRGSLMDDAEDALKTKKYKKVAFPFRDTTLLQVLNHTLWVLPSINSCHAMKNLLEERQNIFFLDYKIVVVAGSNKKLGDIYEAMGDDPVTSKTITLTALKFTMGVTVRPWSGILMLNNVGSAQRYFQTAFRAQSPWYTTDTEKNKKVLLKEDCYIVDFDPNRSAHLIYDYVSELSTVDRRNIDQRLSEFLNYLPVYEYDGMTMQRLDVTSLSAIAHQEISASMIARSWGDPQLIDLRNDTLEALLNDEDTLEALMNLEDFKSLKEDIGMIITKTREIKKRREKDQTTSIEDKKIAEGEKEYVNKRKQIRKKLLKFNNRIPVFMYLTDYREETLEDVITQIDKKLFTKVTNITQPVFRKLVSIGVFPRSKMNKHVLSFRNVENNSLEYLGVDSHISDKIGGWDVKINKSDLPGST